jgi:hypothetical protein
MTDSGEAARAHCQTCYGRDHKLITLHIGRFRNGAISGKMRKLREIPW